MLLSNHLTAAGILFGAVVVIVGVLAILAAPLRLRFPLRVVLPQSLATFVRWLVYISSRVSHDLWMVI